MTAATSRLRRRGIGAGVAALVGLSGLGFAAMPAQAAAGFDPAVSQVSGVDRFDTAARIATSAFSTASTVVVANGDRAIDAQAGAYVAGLNNAPILLTQKSSVPAFTVDAIKKLGATKAIVLGDENSVDATALAQMTAAGLSVTVVAGDDRFETAADIYNLGATKATTVFLARADLLAGQVSPDALAASPLAYDGTPVLLTNAGSLPQATADAIKNGGVKNVVVLGNAITDSVKAAVTALGATVTTIAGDDRSLTAQKIADYGVSTGKYGKTAATIANGDKIDALAAGPWAANNNAPILLTLGTNSLGTGTTNYLTANSSTLVKGTVFGDVNSVPASLTAAAKTAGGGDVTSMQTLAVAPSTAASLEAVAGTESPDVTTDNRSYTVTGLTDATQYRVTLVDAANVNTTTGVFAIDRTAVGVTSTNPDGANGQQVSGNYLALAGTPTARFQSVNGAAAVNNTGAGTTTSGVAVTTSAVANPVNGSLTFVIDGNAPETVVPVVYVNGGPGLANSAGGVSPRLEVNASGVPVESFGLGGATTYTATEADAGSNGGTALPITSVDKTANSFNATVSGVARRFDFDSNDNYQIGGAPSTFAAFAAALSAGDSVTVNYGTDPASVSSFNLTDSNPVLATATAAAGTGSSTNDVTVTATFGAGSLDTIGVERATVTGGVIGSYSVVGTITPTAAQLAAGSATFADNDLAVGTYSYRLTPVNDGDSGAQVVAANVATTSPAADTTAPLALSDRVVTNAGFATDADANDVIRLVFNEDIAITSSAAIRFSDSGGSNFQLTNGTNATFALNSSSVTLTGSDAGTYAANRVLTVTITGNPTPVLGTTSADLPATYNLTVSTSAGITDLAGNAWAGSENAGASATTATAAVSGLTVSADTAGAAGNSLTFQIVTGATGAGNESRALAVTSSGNNTVVTLGTDASGATIFATQSAVQTAVNAVASVPVNVSAVAAGSTAVANGSAVTLSGGAAASSTGATVINP